MSITAAQKSHAEQIQWAAARDTASQVRLVAGPGTGKSATIEKRVAHLLSSGVNPDNIYVISFTRATCAELAGRISHFCSQLSQPVAAGSVHVHTMHSLALRILRRANLLTAYPSTPVILSDWEQSNVYDKEFASHLGCFVSRASQIRLAHDAQWQTLNSQLINQAQITQAEINGFNAFHSTRTNLYCCVLPGEVIYKCVDAMQQGVLQASQLPTIDHLIVDEYQDLNACDQKFVELLCANKTVLFVAGDDDQSIYSFRHADPSGLVQFNTVYPSSATHVLTDCFRCTPQVLAPASRLITYNPNRVVKQLNSMYAASSPVVQGRTLVWSFNTASDEAKAIAVSCQQLISNGMQGREDEILILISNRKAQLNLIAQELGNLSLPYEPPKAAQLTNEFEGIRAVYFLLRLLRDAETREQDYPVHRDILEVLAGVGSATANAIADSCIQNNQNFRALFYLPTSPVWLIGRAVAAVQRVMNVVQTIATWALTDTLSSRASDVTNVLSTMIFTSGRNATNLVTEWTTLVGSLAPQMTLNELLSFLEADSESDQQAILDLVSQRISGGPSSALQSSQKRIRILTMHGAKGLSGKVVFIPGAEQGLMPSTRALQAAGLVIEQRRLFYVSLTRAMACCIVTHAAQHTGAQAMVLAQRASVRFTRSQFVTEMNVPSISRTAGLTKAEAVSICADVASL